jgi:hypothetical protein
MTVAIRPKIRYSILSSMPGRPAMGSDAVLSRFVATASHSPF